MDGPQAFELLGEPLVLWLNDQGNPAAGRDRCCHRTAKLSLGRVDQGHICCPYYGWEFDAAGSCVKVPQLQADCAIPANDPSYRLTPACDEHQHPQANGSPELGNMRFPSDPIAQTSWGILC